MYTAPLKTREMIVSRRGKECITVPVVMVGEIRVEAMKILGITLTSDLKIEEHLNKVLSSAASSMYALGHSEVTVLQARHSKNYGPDPVCLTGLVGLYKSEGSRETRKISRKTETLGFLIERRHGHFSTRDKADQKLFRAIRNNPHHVL